MFVTCAAVPGNQPGCGPIPVGPNLYVSQILCAAALKPTTILVSIGNNDALQALTFGIPPTNQAAFAEQYAALLAGLASTHARIVVSNIPDVTDIPFLVPVPAFNGLCGFTPAHAGVPNRDRLIVGENAVYTFHAGLTPLGNQFLSFITEPK